MGFPESLNTIYKPILNTQALLRRKRTYMESGLRPDTLTAIWPLRGRAVLVRFQLTKEQGRACQTSEAVSLRWLIRHSEPAPKGAVSSEAKLPAGRSTPLWGRTMSIFSAHQR